MTKTLELETEEQRLTPATIALAGVFRVGRIAIYIHGPEVPRRPPARPGSSADLKEEPYHLD
jgi:hypothetical protein